MNAYKVIYKYTARGQSDIYNDSAPALVTEYTTAGEARKAFNDLTRGKKETARATPAGAVVLKENSKILKYSFIYRGTQK